jgi:hypothetical protein
MNKIETIIHLANENAELRRGLKDIQMFMIESKSGKEHHSMKNGDEDICLIFTLLHEALFPKKEE